MSYVGVTRAFGNRIWLGRLRFRDCNPDLGVQTFRAVVVFEAWIHYDAVLEYHAHGGWLYRWVLVRLAGANVVNSPFAHQKLVLSRVMCLVVHIHTTIPGVGVGGRKWGVWEGLEPPPFNQVKL